jgi:hypothetical protein
VAQNAELREELRTLQEHLKYPSPSWVSIVVSGTTTTSSANISQPSRTSTQGSRENILRISTPPSPPEQGADDNNLTRYMEAPMASSLISEALKKDTTTQNIQLAGIGTTKAGYLIRSKDKAAKETATKSEQWLKELGKGIKLVKPRFGVVVHRTLTNEVLLMEDKEKAIAKIVQENDLTDKGFNIEDCMAQEERLSIGSSSVTRGMVWQRGSSRVGDTSWHTLRTKIYRKHRTIQEEGMSVLQLPDPWPRSVELQREEKMRTLRRGT